MDIKKEDTVTMNHKELEIIVKEWIEKHKGIKVDSVDFRIGSHNVEGDWRSEFPPIHMLEAIICTGTEK